jgi:hypothetical protein
MRFLVKENKVSQYFIIQTINGKIEHDFSFILLEAIRYHEWYYHEPVSHTLTDKECPDYIPNATPVGSVEFVSNYLEKHYNLKPKPRNVPDELIKYAGRDVFNGSEKTIRNKDLFAKSNDQIKGFVDFVKPDKKLSPGNYQFSEPVMIESEWRGFVFNGELVGLQNYSGEFAFFPDVNRIHMFIEGFKTAPIAYTLDIFIDDRGRTFVMEIHDFFSCGLYGFADLKLLPIMFSRWFHEFTRGTTPIS